jgi:hypothetical protein
MPIFLTVKLLLALASRVILSSKHRGTDNHILLCSVDPFKVKSRSYVTADGQSTNQCWCQASFLFLSASCGFVHVGYVLFTVVIVRTTLHFYLQYICTIYTRLMSM